MNRPRIVKPWIDSRLPDWMNNLVFANTVAFPIGYDGNNQLFQELRGGREY